MNFNSLKMKKGLPSLLLNTITLTIAVISLEPLPNSLHMS